MYSYKKHRFFQKTINLKSNIILTKEQKWNKLQKPLLVDFLVCSKRHWNSQKNHQLKYKRISEQFLFKVHLFSCAILYEFQFSLALIRGSWHGWLRASYFLNVNNFIRVLLWVAIICEQLFSILVEIYFIFWNFFVEKIRFDETWYVKLIFNCIIVNFKNL